MKQVFISCVTLMVLCSVSFASQPVQLFIIAHNKNANVVRYEAEIGLDGKLDPAVPVKAYWLMLNEDGRRKELTVLDKKAYGFSCEFDNKAGVCNLTIRSFKKRGITIAAEKNQVTAQMLIGGRQSVLKKVYIDAMHALVIPKVRYIELFGKDAQTGKQNYEKIQF